MTNKFVDILDTKDVALLPNGLCNFIFMLHFPGCLVTLTRAFARWLIQDGSDILFQQSMVLILDGNMIVLMICHGYSYLSLVSSCHTRSKNAVLDAARSKMVQDSVIGIVEDAAIVFHWGGAVQYRFAQE